MAILTDEYVTYSAVGIREDLSDIVTTLNPLDTLFYNSLKETEKIVKNRKHEWMTDAIGNAAQNKQLEGDQRAPSAITAATRIYNYHQIQSKTFAISGSNLVATAAGNVTSEDYQTGLFGKRLAGDIEWAFLQEVRTAGNASTEPAMRGVINWITTNLSKDAGATLNVDGSVTGGSSRDLSETILAAAAQLAWATGGNPTIAYCGGFNKRKFSSLSGYGNYRTYVENKTLETSVDVYVGDFNTIKVVPHRIMPTSVMIGLDMDYWYKATYRPLFKEQVSSTIDGKVLDMRVEHTLEARQEASSFRITNLSTS